MEDNKRNQLVVDNINYVKSLANKYKGRGIEFDDLVSEGCMAMAQAAQKFDIERGTPFVSYAAPFIRKAMEQAIRQNSDAYSVPKDSHNKIKKEISRPLSVDAPLSANNKYTLLDILVNKDVLQADDNAYLRMIAKHLRSAIEQLNEREQMVVSKFFGIGCPHITMAEIAEDMGLKRERVRQIRNKAVRKMSRSIKKVNG